MARHGAEPDAMASPPRASINASEKPGENRVAPSPCRQNVHRTAVARRRGLRPRRDRSGTGDRLDTRRSGAFGRARRRAARRLLPEIRSEEHTSDLQSLMLTSYSVFGLIKKHQQT